MLTQPDRADPIVYRVISACCSRETVTNPIWVPEFDGATQALQFCDMEVLPPIKTFPDRLRYCIEAVGSVRELSRRTGISEAMIYRYLNESSDMLVAKAIAIAKSANVPAGWLLGTDARLEYITRDEAAIIKAAVVDMRQSLARFNAVLEQLKILEE